MRAPRQHGIDVYADPDGNRMAFQVECFAAKREALDYFRGPTMGVNPIGVESDPDEWLGRLRRGTPASALPQRQVHEPVSPIRGSFARAA